MPGNFASVSQFPLNVAGPKGQNAFVGMHSVFFTGLTGLVGTSYGIPGVVATRVSTGVYNIVYPSTRSVHIIPGLQCPTGHAYFANVAQINPISGTAQIHISRQQPTPSGVGSPSLPMQPFNPVSGAILNLLFFVSPTVAY